MQFGIKTIILDDFMSFLAQNSLKMTKSEAFSSIGFLEEQNVEMGQNVSLLAEQGTPYQLVEVDR